LQNKPTTLTAKDTTTKQVDSENLTSTTEVAKEISDQATSPIEVVSTTPGNSEKLDDLISKNHLHLLKNHLKKTGGKKVSSLIKQLIEELLTDIPDS
ncbi:39679_t:CDS:2, partial [Gigaspora margarita]